MASHPAQIFLVSITSDKHCSKASLRRPQSTFINKSCMSELSSRATIHLVISFTKFAQVYCHSTPYPHTNGIVSETFTLHNVSVMLRKASVEETLGCPHHCGSTHRTVLPQSAKCKYATFYSHSKVGVVADYSNIHTEAELVGQVRRDTTPLLSSPLTRYRTGWWPQAKQS